MNYDLKDTLKQAEENLTDLIRERDEKNITIIELQGKIRSLRAVLEFDSLAAKRAKIQQSAVGLTEAIRSILRLAHSPMSAPEVKKSLTVMGFDFSNFSNPSAVIHSTLKRMASTGELVKQGKMYRLPGGKK